jgi:hypothetical protein
MPNLWVGIHSTTYELLKILILARLTYLKCDQHILDNPFRLTATNLKNKLKKVCEYHPGAYIIKLITAVIYRYL